jgi:hypothetical protein
MGVIDLGPHSTDIIVCTGQSLLYSGPAHVVYKSAAVVHEEWPSVSWQFFPRGLESLRGFWIAEQRTVEIAAKKPDWFCEPA